MPLSHPKFKAAAVQAAPAYLDLDATVAKTIDLIGAAARGSSRFPNAGYPATRCGRCSIRWPGACSSSSAISITR